MIAEFGGRVLESEGWSVGAPLQWRNQLWQSLGARTGEARSVRVPLQWRNQTWQSLAEECLKARLGMWECPFSGVTNDGRVWRKGAGKRGLEWVQT